MLDPAIRRKRAENALYERLREAIASLGDNELSELNVLGAELSRDKRDATAFIDSAQIDESARPRLLGKLKKASGYLAAYIVASEGWRRSPALHFKFDGALGEAEKLDRIFARIRKGED